MLYHGGGSKRIRAALIIGAAAGSLVARTTNALLPPARHFVHAPRQWPAKQRYVDELSKVELFERMKDGERPDHDEVIIRRSKRSGRSYSIPQAERYRSRDWGHILLETHNSVVLQRIRSPLAWNIVWAGGVVALHRMTGHPQKSFVAIHALLGSALGLLLVFRTNAAYQRFWGGLRKRDRGGGLEQRFCAQYAGKRSSYMSHETCLGPLHSPLAQRAARSGSRFWATRGRLPA